MAIHAAMVHRVDREIGRVVEKLKALGALDNTAIFLLSDNGASAEIPTNQSHRRRTDPKNRALARQLGQSAHSFLPT